ncbi:amidohydrolase [Baekduia soli]|uniref:Amidohydrolase n=1 Tax=Baekduia soli TaxID=496014 RepID=A0A5B8UAD3_9ACTN|nr:amidohydrolase family protein [Baekduia soli]QEC49768.1 amidohydrolase [Baekduia soli]
MSETATAVRPQGGPAQRDFIVDCDSHNLPTLDDLKPYLSRRWSEYLDTFGLRTPSEYGIVRARWMASRADSWGPTGKPPGSDPEFFIEQLLDGEGIDIAILNSIMMAGQNMVGGGQPQEFTNALMAATNDWVAEQWLDRDDRLRASICTPFEDPESLVREAERWYDDDRFVQIQVPFRTNKPLGHRKYWDLYEISSARGMPLALHPGSTGQNLITGAGWVTYYYEDHVGFPQALFNQMASMVCEGVFERFPDMKIVIQEGGWSWVAPFLWRFDRAFEQLKGEVPHLQRRPSEYIREHFWFTTQPIEEPERPEHFGQALAALDMPGRLLFSSDYPHWDFDPPSALPTSLDDDLRRGILGENALAVYDLPREGVR